MPRRPLPTRWLLSAPMLTRQLLVQPPKLPWTRRLGSQFSWKFAGGVVAAGLILGFFAFNLQHPMLEQADGLSPKAHLISKVPDKCKARRPPIQTPHKML